jgi:hypothetical protein
VRPHVEEVFYNVPVTAAELWQLVGQRLLHARVDRHWKPIDVERNGGPSYKTVQAIEVGDVGTVDSLDKCARALGLSIVDVLDAVLTSQSTPLSPEAAHVVRKFAETTVAGRTALLSMANALPSAELTGGLEVAAPAAPRPPRPGRPGVKRRTAR